MQAQRLAVGGYSSSLTALNFLWLSLYMQITFILFYYTDMRGQQEILSLFKKPSSALVNWAKSKALLLSQWRGIGDRLIALGSQEAGQRKFKGLSWIYVYLPVEEGGQGVVDIVARRAPFLKPRRCCMTVTRLG